MPRRQASREVPRSDFQSFTLCSPLPDFSLPESMEYERIHKVQMGVISPSKLRIRLLGSPHHKRKEGGNNSSRTSPSKLEDMEYIKNSLLSSKNIDADEGSSKDSEDASAPNAVAPNIESSVRELLDKEVPGGHDNGISSCSMDKETAGTDHDELEDVPKGILYQVLSGNSSTVHPVRSIDDGNGYDSGHDNCSSSSFEFHKGERPPINSVSSPFSRPVPSKWTDAEKWIVNRQVIHPNLLKKSVLQSQGSRQVLVNSVKVAPETLIPDHRTSVVQAADNKKIDFYLSKSQNVVEKFPYVPCGSHPISEQAHGTNTSRQSDIPMCQKKMNHDESFIADRTVSDTAATPTAKSVSMRDMGTEMTPMTSQEPSRTGTPIAATTPTRSPISSRSSTPQRGEPAPSPVELMTEGGNSSKHQVKCNKTELSEREFQLKIRREIGALGVQLGKMNIAAWASKDEVTNTDSLKAVEADQLQKIEFETRAAAWEEAEKSKHMARFKREGVRIEVWESHQKAKYDAKMREVEAQAEQMRVDAQEKMMKKLAITKQRLEEKLATAEARKNQQAARTAHQVEQIRRTGRIPQSHFRCCSWFS